MGGCCLLIVVKNDATACVIPLYTETVDVLSILTSSMQTLTHSFNPQSYQTPISSMKTYYRIQKVQCV